MSYEIKRITIAREGWSDKNPFEAQINIKDTFGNAEMSIRVDEHRTLEIIDIIQPLIVEALTARFENLRDAQVAAIQSKEALRIGQQQETKAEDVEDAEVTAINEDD